MTGALIAMEDAGTILSTYVIVLGGVAGYAWWMIRRGRQLANEVPDEDKSWT
jgi:hypothetical protein